MTYPITIVDDFFEDPDAIVKMANELKYYPPDTGNWPGMRTKQLHVVEDRFFQYFGEKIMLLFHDNTPEYWKLQSHFQKILPFHEDQYDKLNRGWIHQDLDTYFGGIVYLTKDPEPDTGTSIYKTTTGFAMQYAMLYAMLHAMLGAVRYVMLCFVLCLFLCYCCSLTRGPPHSTSPLALADVQKVAQNHGGFCQNLGRPLASSDRIFATKCSCVCEFQCQEILQKSLTNGSESTKIHQNEPKCCPIKKNSPRD